LLLHAMGPELADTPAYSAFVSRAGGQPAVPARAQAAQKGGAATDEEWRTPPLWGLRDSAPYLHDGRATSIEEAIVQHGGEGAASAQRFRQLSARDQSQLKAFLMSLSAPRGPHGAAGP
jgi:CxxC motif-containing protein (DUF1111 family)